MVNVWYLENFVGILDMFNNYLIKIKVLYFFFFRGGI